VPFVVFVPCLGFHSYFGDCSLLVLTCLEVFVVFFFFLGFAGLITKCPVSFLRARGACIANLV